MYRIKLLENKDQKKSEPISSLYADYCKLSYLEADLNRTTLPSFGRANNRDVNADDSGVKPIKRSITERVVYKPIFNKMGQKPVEPKIRLGTMKGNQLQFVMNTFDDFHRAYLFWHFVRNVFI